MTNALAPASFLNGKVLVGNGRDPAFRAKGAAPNFARFPVAHAKTFSGIWTTGANVYLQSDEALLDSLENARIMRKDVGIMECLEARQRATALLGWHLEPEDEKDKRQVELCNRLRQIVERIGRFTEYRRNLLEAIWYGRYAIQHRYRWVTINGRRYVAPSRVRDNPGWKPIHGDKLAWRFEKFPGDPKADQLGIRVWGGYDAGDVVTVHNGVQTRAAKIETTDRGLAYFLEPYERDLIAVHKHTIEDGEFEEPRTGGRIHGVGIRDRIYYDWLQKQEILAFLMEFLERSAGGIRIWNYPDGNEEALNKAQEAAREVNGGAKTDLFFPKPLGEDGMAYDLQIVEPGMAGVDTLHNLLTDYFGHRIKRYILGQTLTTEADSTGMGSGVADAHMDSFLQIVEFDANNLDETITEELIEPLKNWNFPGFRDVRVRFVSDVESEDVKAKLEALEKAWSMGTRISENSVLDLLGLSAPGPDEKVLENKAAGADPSAMGGLFGGGGPGGPAGPGGAAPGGPAGPQPGGPEGGEDGDGPEGDTPRDGAPQQYAAFREEEHPRDEAGRFTEGDAAPLVNGYEHDPPGAKPVKLIRDPLKVVKQPPVFGGRFLRQYVRDYILNDPEFTKDVFAEDLRKGMIEPQEFIRNAERAYARIERFVESKADDDGNVNGEDAYDHAGRMFSAWVLSPQQIADEVFKLAGEMKAERDAKRAAKRAARRGEAPDQYDRQRSIWDESKHPRDDHGMFSSGGSGKGGPKPKAAPSTLEKIGDDLAKKAKANKPLPGQADLFGGDEGRQSFVDSFNAAFRAKGPTGKVTDSPAFKKWFEGSKVVDQDGQPLLVYHGTNAAEEFDTFEPTKPQSVFRVDGEEAPIANFWDYGDDAKGMPEGYHYGAVTDALQLGAEEAHAFRMKEALRSRPGGNFDASTHRHINDLKRLIGKKIGQTTEHRPTGDGSYFTPNLNYSFTRDAGHYEKGRIKPVYLSIKNPAYLNSAEIESAGLSHKVEKLKAQGYDGAIFAEHPDDLTRSGWGGATQIVAFHPEQIKSAIGNRGTFDPKDKRITYQREGDADRYAKKHKPAPNQQGFRWITLNGGSGDDGDGGTPVLIDDSGNIKGGPKALEGKNLDNLDKGKAGTSKDERKKGTSAADEPGGFERAAQHNFDNRFTNPVIDRLKKTPWITAAEASNAIPKASRKSGKDFDAVTADLLKEQADAGAVQVAWDESGMPHYAPAGHDVPEHLATQDEIDAAGGEFPKKKPASPGRLDSDRLPMTEQDANRMIDETQWAVSQQSYEAKNERGGHTPEQREQFRKWSDQSAERLDQLKERLADIQSGRYTPPAEKEGPSPKFKAGDVVTFPETDDEIGGRAVVSEVMGDGTLVGHWEDDETAEAGHYVLGHQDQATRADDAGGTDDDRSIVAGEHERTAAEHEQTAQTATDDREREKAASLAQQHKAEAEKVKGTAAEPPKSDTSGFSGGPYTLETFNDSMKRLREGSITADEWKAQYKHLRENKDEVVAGLMKAHNAKMMQHIAMQLGRYRGSGAKKGEYADAIYSGLLSQYNITSDLAARLIPS